MVETSTAVATPSTTAARMRNGRISAGIAITKARADLGAGGALAHDEIVVRPSGTTRRPRAPAQAPAAGSSPPVNSAAIETLATEPITISTTLGGIVSAIAPEAASSETSSPGFIPRAFISGNSTGATAAMSAAFAPEMPDTRYIAPSSTYESPPRTWPSSEARNATIARAMPVMSIRMPRKTNSGIDSSSRCDIPSSMRLTITVKRRARRERHIPDGCDAERKRDRYAAAPQALRRRERRRSRDCSSRGS